MHKKYKISPGENITDYDLICYHCEHFEEHKDTEVTGHFECAGKQDILAAIEAGDCDGFDERKHVSIDVEEIVAEIEADLKKKKIRVEVKNGTKI